MVGIPDECMILGDISLYSMVRRLKFMPLLIIASRICPEGAEATLFALLMSLSNLGDTVAINVGAIILRIFNVTDDDYSNFIYAVIVKSLLRLTLIPFIPLLAPEGSPQTRDEYETDQDDKENKDIEVKKYKVGNHDRDDEENGDGNGDDDNNNNNENIGVFRKDNKHGESEMVELTTSSGDSTSNENNGEKRKWIKEKKHHDIVFAEEYVSPIAQSAIIT